METYKYRWVARLADGYLWDSFVVGTLQAALAAVSKLQADEDAAARAGNIPEGDRLTYSIERAPVPPVPEWEPYNPTTLNEES